MDSIVRFIKENRIEVLAVCAITLFALALRLVKLFHFGDLWLDELYSWYFADMSNVFQTVKQLILQDLHMPIYFIILHFWIKIFGNSDMSMHLCTLFLTLPLIPISFYIVKRLFNPTAAYFAALMFSINSFCIYYSLEIRFYGLVIVLALISAYLFVRMLEDFTKKYITLFIISQILLIYTFTSAPLLTFCYGLVGGIYILLENKSLWKDFLRIFLGIFILSVPNLLITEWNMLVLNSSISSFSKDIYIFDAKVILDMIENYFSNENFQLATLRVIIFRNIFLDFLNVNYTLFVGIPIIIGMFGFLNSFLSKDKKLYLFLMPSIVFTVLSMILGALGVISFLTRYSCIVYPIIACAACYGLSNIKMKFLRIAIFVLYLILNCSYYLLVPKSLLITPRIRIGDMKEVMQEYIDLRDNDLILIPYSGPRILRYVEKGKFIPFVMDDAILLKDNFSKKFYFGENYDKLNRNNIKSAMREYVVEDKVSESYEANLLRYISQMKPKERLVFISNRETFIKPLLDNKKFFQEEKNYNRISAFNLLMAKMMDDTLRILSKYLTVDTIIENPQREYTIYLYEKQ